MISKERSLDDEISAAVIGGILSVLEDFKQSGQPIDHEAVMRGLTTAYTMFALRSAPRVAIAALATMSQVIERGMAEPVTTTQPPQD